MSVSFDRQPWLEDADLCLRPLERDDLDGLYAAASEPETWAGHPAKDRHLHSVFLPYFEFLLASHSTLVVVEQASGKIIGCSRYYTAPDRPDTISIGFTFLRHVHWGGAVNLALKRLMLTHAFAHFDAVWFHIDPTNIRSQKATAKLGAAHVYDAVLDLSGAPAKWMCFRLDRTVWEDRVAAR